MELQLISDPVEINKLHKQFGSLIKNNSTKGNTKLNISTRGGSGEFIYYVDDNSNVWWNTEPDNHPIKFYNRFGINPRSNRTNHIAIQVNYQKKFENFQEAAVWAKDARGRNFLLHSGKMGGGVSGITKENVDDLFNGKRAFLVANGQEHQYYVVCLLNSARAFSQVVTFVKEIERVKRILKNENESEDQSQPPRGGSSRAKISRSFILRKYKPEFWGKRKYTFKRQDIDSETDHGYVVDCLKIELEAFGEVVKNQFIDLGLIKNRKPKSIFEVKTGLTKQMIYTAVGQLVMHAYSSKTDPDKYFVAPKEIDSAIEKDLAAIGIATIKYEWRNNKPVFLNLDKFFNAR